MVLLPWFTYIKTNIIYGANVRARSGWQHVDFVFELAGCENDVKDASDDSLLTRLDHSSVCRISNVSFPGCVFHAQRNLSAWFLDWQKSLYPFHAFPFLQPPSVLVILLYEGTWRRKAFYSPPPMAQVLLQVIQLGVPSTSSLP